MSKTIEELEVELARVRAAVQLDFRSTHEESQAELDKVCAAQEKLTAQKYEAIIEERVRETVEQRLTRPQLGDYVMSAIDKQKEELRARFYRGLQDGHGKVVDVLLALENGEDINVADELNQADEWLQAARDAIGA